VIVRTQRLVDVERHQGARIIERETQMTPLNRFSWQRWRTVSDTPPAKLSWVSYRPTNLEDLESNKECEYVATVDRTACSMTNASVACTTSVHF